VELRVIRSNPSTVTLQWQAHGVIKPLDVYIERAGSFTGPYAQISGPIRDSNQYIDTNLLRGVAYFYRLRLDTQGEEFRFLPASGGKTFGPRETLVVAEARYQRWFSLYYGGRLCLYYPVRTFGAYCSCYNTTRGVHDSKCLTCYGRKYAGGYFNPIVLPYQGTAVQSGQPETNRVKGDNRMLVLPGIFRAHEQDAIVDENNDRWAVSKVMMMTFEGALVTQQVIVAPVPADSPIHQLPVDLDLLELPQKFTLEKVT